MIVRIVAVAVIVLALGITPVMQPLTDAVRGGRLAALEGDYTAAAQRLRDAYAIQPWESDLLAEAVQAAILAGDPETIIAGLQELSTVRPLTADEFAVLGQAHADLDQYRDAIKAWEQAERAGTGSAGVLHQLLDIYLGQEEWQRALGVLDSLVELDPGNARLRYQRGLLLGLIDPDASLVAFQEAVALDTELYAQRVARIQRALLDWETTPAGYARLGVAYMDMGEYRFAELAFDQALEQDPRYAEAMAYYGYALSRRGDTGLGPAMQAVRIAPENPLVLYLAGLTWSENSRPLEARQYFSQAYTLDPDNPAFAVEIGATYQAEGRDQLAEQWMQEAVSLAPGDQRFTLLLVQFYVDANYRVEERGLPLAQALVEANPNDAEALAALGWAQFLTGDTGAAANSLAEALAINPNLARARAHYGIVLEELNQQADARDQYEQAIQLDPFGPWGALARRRLEAAP
ncbi:MAG: tetratricopeptide repeat protein [Chloroflexi bacterium]|nr:tetratricopeptide repeat protein [Chloroflexota bacterium]